MSREAFEAWARDNNITFVSRSSGQYTTDTVSRDALRNLWQAARAAALEEAAQLCESQCAGISYANGNQGPCLTEFPKKCGGRHDGMTYADAIRALKEKE